MSTCGRPGRRRKNEVRSAGNRFYPAATLGLPRQSRIVNKRVESGGKEFAIHKQQTIPALLGTPVGWRVAGRVVLALIARWVEDLGIK
jgi:hypothetical protein